MPCDSPCPENTAPKASELLLTPEERAAIFGISDPALIGNRLAKVINWIGIPPCSGCEKRRQWLYKAQAWLRGDKA